MVKVYSVFANKGLFQEPTFIRRIETQEGEVLIDFDLEEPEQQQILSEEQSIIMTQMLQSVVDSGTARRLRYRYQLHNEIAGKTGTTQHHSDGWFIGYTPHLVAGAWVGAESPKVRFRTLSLGQGANTALPIWGRFMNKVYASRDFRAWRNSRFTPLPDSTQYWMDCPPYLPSMPIYTETLPLYEDETTENVFDWIFKNKQGEEVMINEKPRLQRGNSSSTNSLLPPKRKKPKKKPKNKKKNKGVLECLFGN